MIMIEAAMKTSNGFRVIAPAIIAVLVLSSLSSAAFPVVFASRSGVTDIVILSAPTKANPGQKLTFSWEVAGLGSISSTGVYWDTKPGNAADYKSYSKFTAQFEKISPADKAPKQYTTTIDAPQSGSIFYIIHATVDGVHLYNMDGERIIPVGAPTNVAIEIKSVPAAASAGEKLTFAWEVTGTGKILHTAVHWDTKPGNPADFKSYTKAAPDYAAIDPPHDAPHGYSVTIEAPQASTMYYIIHAIVDGKDLYVAKGERVLPLKVAGVAPIEPKPSSPPKEVVAATADSTTLMLGAGAVIVIVAVGIVVWARRKKTA